MNTCRFCHEWRTTPGNPMVQYGPRHNAHLGCGIDRWGNELANKLSVNTLRHLPTSALRKHPEILALVRAKVAAWDAREKRQTEVSPGCSDELALRGRLETVMVNFTEGTRVQSLEHPGAVGTVIENYGDSLKIEWRTPPDSILPFGAINVELWRRADWHLLTSL